MNHGDAASTAKDKSDNHGEQGGHGGKQKQGMETSLSFSVLSVFSVVNAFDFGFRRVRRVAVVKGFSYAA